MGTGRIAWSAPPIPFSGWFGHPAAFDGATLARALTGVQINPGGLVVDPFCGTGATICASAARGLRAVGLEAHPLTAHLAHLKLTADRDTAALRTEAEILVRDLTRAPTGGEHSFVQRCFDEPLLGLLVALRDRIGASDSPWRGHIELALLAGLRDHACVRVGWAYQQPSIQREPRSIDPAGNLIERVTAWV